MKRFMILCCMIFMFCGCAATSITKEEIDLCQDYCSDKEGLESIYDDKYGFGYGCSCKDGAYKSKEGIYKEMYYKEKINGTDK